MYGTYCRLNLHVSASNREVIKAASRKIKKHHRYARKVRDDRHAFYREMLEHHKDARELYAQMNKELPDNDYVLTEGAGWFDVKGFVIRIRQTANGVEVNIYQSGHEMDNPIDGCYVFNSVLEEEEESE